MSLIYKTTGNTPNYVERSKPYRYKKPPLRKADINTSLEKIEDFSRRFFQKIYCYYYNTIIACYNILKLYKFEKKQLSFNPANSFALFFSQAIMPRFFSPDKFDYFDRAFYKLPYIFDSELPANKMTFSSFIKISALLITTDMLVDRKTHVAFESAYVAIKSLQNLKDSIQLYKINKRSALRYSTLHTSLFIINAYLLIQSIKKVEACSNISSESIEDSIKTFESKNGRKPIVLQEAYYNRLNPACPEHTALLLDLEIPLSKKNKEATSIGLNAVTAKSTLENCFNNNLATCQPKTPLDFLQNK